MFFGNAEPLLSRPRLFVSMTYTLHIFKGLWSLITTPTTRVLLPLALLSCSNTVLAQGHSLHIVMGCVNGA